MARLDDLPPLREVIATHGLRARKALGQNFLLDLNLTARIARAAGELEGVTVIEVGPGPGGLTRALLAGGASRIVAVERDDRAIPALEQIAAHYPGRLDVVAADALDVDFGQLAGPRTKIVANLPFNIATRLLAGWLTAPWPPFWESLTLMFQREVAERIVAGPGSKVYGRLSVLVGWRTKARIILDVPSSAFTPRPKVSCSVVCLEPRSDAEEVSVKAMEALTRAAFGQRRKMLRQSLKSLGRPPEMLLEAAGLNGTERAEDIPVAGFVSMARTLGS